MTPPVVTHRNTRRRAVLGIDLGTSAVKAVVAGLDGQVIGQAVGDYPVVNAYPGWSETDPSAWMAATVAAVRTAVAQADAEPCAIGLSGQMHGLVPTDATGNPTRLAMLWSDVRANDQLSIYRRLPSRIRARLANPLSPGMTGPMLAWLATHEPGSYADMRWALQPKDWLRAQLSGQFATEPSDASATLLYDLAGDNWDAEVLHALQFDPERLPKLLPTSASAAGELSPGAARTLGLRAGIPIAAGAADTAAAALGSGLVKPGSVQLTIGTGAQLITPVSALPHPLPDNPVAHLYRAATDSGWYAMGATLNGGSALAWARQILGATWQQLYAAAAIEPSLDDPYFLPHLHGERTPYLEPRLRGAWTDLEPRHQREHLLRAALEGVAFAIRDILDVTLPAGRVASHLGLAGGGTADPLWRQMLADVLEYPLSAVDVAAASALGAAILAARVAGVADEKDISAGWAPISRTAAEPRGTWSTVYRERYGEFERKVLALRPVPRENDN